MGRDSYWYACIASINAFQSTRPVWGATLCGCRWQAHWLISIHAPRVGRDWACSGFLLRWNEFQSTRPVWGATKLMRSSSSILTISIHAPRVGRDDLRTSHATPRAVFQSTRPVWGATVNRYVKRNVKLYFNPRAPCGARRSPLFVPRPSMYFNPRAPCGARRYGHVRLVLAGRDFNPRAPCGARQDHRGCSAGCSIDFNPRAPCGARLTSFTSVSVFRIFQSTRPVWGATTSTHPAGQVYSISIHAPRVGRD